MSSYTKIKKLKRVFLKNLAPCKHLAHLSKLSHAYIHGNSNPAAAAESIKSHITLVRVLFTRKHFHVSSPPPPSNPGMPQSDG